MRRAIHCALLLLMITFSRHGISQASGSVRGTVVDPTGAGVPGASIQVLAAHGAPISESVTDSQGAFAILNLPRGNLFLVVPPFLGFSERRIPIRLASSLSGIRIALQLASVQQQISVTSGEELSTDASSNRDTVSTSGDELRKLPVFDQDYIAALTPFLDSSAVSSGGATIVVDGVEMKSAGVSASAIQEVRVNNDPFSAEFNRPGRGRIEIITKPGSPVFHGEGNFTIRDAIFDARNYFSVVRPPEARRIYEGHLSGPIGRNGRTNFIASASRRHQDSAVVVNAVTNNGTVNENVLTPNTDSQDSIRINHDFSASNRISIGYNFELSSSTNAGVGGITLPEAGVDLDSREDDAILNSRKILTPNLISQLQVTLEKDEDVTRSVTDTPSMQVSGSFVGGGAQADLARTENTIHVNEVVSWSHRNHYLRAGIQLPQFSRRAVDDHTNRLGTFKFASLASFEGGTPYVYTAQQGTGRGLYWINEFGAFLQDQIKLSPSVQTSLGLRFDWQTFLADNNNFAPRVSLAYSPGKRKTIFRIGTGVFYDRTGGDFPAIVKLHNGIVLHTIQIENPSFPLQPVNASSLPTNLAQFDRNIRAPYAIQYSLGFERQLRRSVTVTAAYRGQLQVKSFRSRDANAPILPPNPDLAADYPRPDPQLGQVQDIESAGRTLLNALDLSFRGQAGRWFSGQAQYTLSRFEGNTGRISFFPQDQYHPNQEWGRADQDRLEKLNLAGNVFPDHWFSFGVNATLYSGLPYTEITGDDYFHSGLGNARPSGIGRNSLQGGGVASLDLSYVHDFHLTKAKGENARILTPGIAAFNALNRTNYTEYIGTVTSTRFEEPTAALAGRQLQFSIGYRF
jgi:hypothetical protein